MRGADHVTEHDGEMPAFTKPEHVALLVIGNFLTSGQNRGIGKRVAAFIAKLEIGRVFSAASITDSDGNALPATTTKSCSGQIDRPALPAFFTCNDYLPPLGFAREICTSRLIYETRRYAVHSVRTICT
jgi:hypothetical protein